MGSPQKRHQASVSLQASFRTWTFPFRGLLRRKPYTDPLKHVSVLRGHFQNRGRVQSRGVAWVTIWEFC